MGCSCFDAKKATNNSEYSPLDPQRFKELSNKDFNIVSTINNSTKLLGLLKRLQARVRGMIYRGNLSKTTNKKFLPLNEYYGEYKIAKTSKIVIKVVISVRRSD